MIKDILNSVKDYFSNVANLATGKKVVKNPQLSKPLDDVSIMNAQSWNPQTHPNGRGPSQLVDVVDYKNTDGSGTLDVTYRDGFTAEYKNISAEQAKDFINSDSKGRWALNNLWNKPYTAK